MTTKKVLVVIPAYNEEKTIGEVILNLKKEGFKNILVVDDGSCDKTAEIAKKANAQVISHIINIGVGNALKTGFSYATKNGFDYVLTCDGDNQHLAKDVSSVFLHINKNKSDVVIGSRLKSLKTKNVQRYLVTLISNLLTLVLYGVWVSDSGSGLRAYNGKAIKKLYLNSGGYEALYEQIGNAKKLGLKIEEIPISAIYTEYSLKKGQKLGNAFRVLRKLLFS